MMRLDRLLATLGLGSRSEVKVFIRSARIMVNDVLCTDAGRQIIDSDTLSFDNQPMNTQTQHHLMMNKPQGLLTAARDSKQETVMGLLSPLYQSCGCMPVGRLDKDTEGLLLFTTDGKAAHRLLSPKNKVQKIYQARVTGKLDSIAVQRFKEGISLSDFQSMPAELSIQEAGEDESLALVTLHEGKYHQVKRMFGACGHEVLHLRRLQFGSLKLDADLSPGQYRQLSDSEWSSLLKECSIEA